MNKIAKASIAGAAGVILLMGGAGSLAYWNNSANLGSGNNTVTAGSLSVASAGAGTWTRSFNGGTSSSVTLSTAKIVPGDALSYTESFNVTAVGDNLKFKVDAVAPTTSGTLTGSSYLAPGTITVTAYDTVGGTGTVITPSSGTTYTVSQNVKSIKVSVPFNWAFGTTAPASNGAGDNAAQGTTGTIGGTGSAQGTITITQVAS